MKLSFSKTPLGKFRMVGLAEGTSFILLLMAMPVKYILGHPEGVKVIGWIHGILFIWYMIALFQVQKANNWSFRKSFIALIASLLPFGTYILDVSLQKEEENRAIEKA